MELTGVGMIPAGGVDIRIGAKLNRFGRLSHQLVQAHTLKK